MCGICGIFNLKREPISKHVLMNMTRILAHRGPDDEGIYIDNNLGLGHRRLSILDLTPAGHQPMVFNECNLAVSYNGEIYNYPELRNELETKGYRFQSGTDTEMILKAYAEWGISALRKFNGMFAIALWDGVNKQLYLIRDRLGVKPIYYYHTKSSFIFASEIKSLLMHPDVELNPDITSLAELAEFRYVIEPDTVFAGISKVKAGHYLCISEDDIKDVCWWDVKFQSESENKSYEYIKEYENLLSSAVAMRLLADVQVGAFLSGGIDSSTVAYYISKVKKDLHTFNVGFGLESNVDESGEARFVSSQLNTTHHELSIKPPTLQELKKIIWHLEEPILDPAVIPTYAVSALASNYVKVVLTGEGSDEINGGYNRYRRAALYHTMNKILPGWAIRAVNKLNCVTSERFRERMRVLLSLQSGNLTPLGFLNINNKPINYESIDRERILNKLNSFTPHPSESSDLFLSKLFYMDLKTWLVSDLLIKVDKMSMAHSLEARTPYLDYRLVEFCAKVPSCKKVTFRKTKKLLRQTMKAHLPARTVNRLQHGFLVPIDKWVIDSLGGDIKEILSSKIGEGILGFKVNGKLTPRSIFNQMFLKLWYTTFFIDFPRKNENLF